MSIKNLPKEVLDLFPRWSYQCPKCGEKYDEVVQSCVQCGTLYEQSKWRVPPRFLKSHDAMSEYAHKVLAPKLTQKQRELLFQYFTELFNDGFESGDFSDWTSTDTSEAGDTITVVSTDPHHGTYHARAYTDGDGGSEYAWARKTLDNIETLYQRAYIKIVTSGVSESGDKFHVFRIYGNYNTITLVGCGYSSGNLVWHIQGRDGTGWVTDTSSTVVSTGIWYCVELYWYYHATNGAVTLWIDGAEICSLSGLDTTSYGGADDTRLGIPEAINCGVCEVYVDCVVVADTKIGLETFEDGFESGDFSAWTDTSGSPTVVTDPVYKGTYAMETTGTGGCYAYKSGFIKDEVYARVYLRTPSSINSGSFSNFLYLHSEAPLYSSLLRLGIKNDSGTWKWRIRYHDDGLSSETLSTQQTPSASTWYCVEVYFKRGATNGEYKVYINENELTDITQSGCVVDYQMHTLYVGNPYSTDYVVLNIDCVVVADTYIGPETGEPPTGAEAYFETGDLSEFDDTETSNGTVTVTSAVAHHGAYSCKCDVNADGNAYAEGYFDITAQQPVYCRGYFRFNQLPETDRDYTIISFENTGSSTVGYIQLVDDGGTKKWKMKRTTGGGATYSTSTSNIPEADTWVCVEFAHGEDLAKLWVDGDELLVHTDATAQTIDRVHVGACSVDIDADDTLEIHIDCIIVTDTYIGPEGDPLPGVAATFETGNLSEFDDKAEYNGTISPTTDVAHHGTYSCKCSVNAAGAAYAEGYFDIDSQQPVYCRGYFRFNQLPESNRDYTIISFENTSGPTTVGYIQLIDDGETKWKMRRDTGSATYSTSTSNIPTVGTWVCVEFIHGDDLAKLWVDGDELLSHADATDQAIDRVHVGACSADMDADSGLEICVDCIAVDNTHIGPEPDMSDAKIFMVDPDGDNDDAKIQYAVNAAEAAGGGVVLLNGGTYDIQNKITVGSRINVIGCGDSTQLDVNADIDYVFETKSGQLNWRNVFADFYINGKRNERETGSGIHLRNCQHAEVRSCRLQDFKTHCVYLSGTETYQTLGCHLHYNYMRDCLDDFVTNGPEVYDLLAEHNIIGGFCGDPVTAYDGEGKTIGTAFVLSWNTHAIIHHNHMWHVKRGVHAFFAHHAKITSNIIDMPHEIGISVQNSNGVTVHDNTIKNHNWINNTFDAGILVFGSQYPPPPPPPPTGPQYYSDDVTITANRVYCQPSDWYDEYWAYYGKFGIKVGDFARRAFIDGNNCHGTPQGNQDLLWDIYVTENGTDGVMFGINMGRCPGPDYKHLSYPNTHLITSLLIGPGGVLANQLVSISANNTVIKATQDNSAKGIGVTIEAGNENDTAKILAIGRIPIKAGAAVQAGEMITASNTYPGRGIPVPATYYNITTSEAPAHGHSCTLQGSHVHVIDGIPDHDHGGTSGAGGSHYHTTDNASVHYHGGSTGFSSGPHTHPVGYNTEWKNTSDYEGHHHSYEDKIPKSPTDSSSGSHQHGISGDGSHYHTTGNPLPSATHGHPITPDGNHAHTMQYNDDHLHTIGLDGAHTHTVAIPLGKVFGKAATSAALNENFDLLLTCGQ